MPSNVGKMEQGRDAKSIRSQEQGGLSIAMTISDKAYLGTREVCRRLGISRLALLRWLTNGVLQDIPRRYRRGWLLFTQAELKRIEDEVNKITQNQLY